MRACIFKMGVHPAVHTRCRALAGIVDADVAGVAPRWQAVAAEWAAFLEGAVLHGYNAKRFDVPMLRWAGGGSAGMDGCAWASGSINLSHTWMCARNSRQQDTCWVKAPAHAHAHALAAAPARCPRPRVQRRVCARGGRQLPPAGRPRCGLAAHLLCGE